MIMRAFLLVAMVAALSFILYQGVEMIRNDIGTKIEQIEIGG
jgi:hypothetical protein